MLTTIEIFSHVSNGLLLLSLLWFLIALWRKFKRRRVFLVQFVIEACYTICLFILFVSGFPVLDVYLLGWLARLPFVFVVGRSYLLATKKR